MQIGNQTSSDIDIPLESLSSCVDLPFGSLSLYDQEKPPVGKSESEILCCQEEFFRSSFVSSPYWRRTEPPSSQGTPVPAFRSRPSGRESFAPPKVPGPAAARSKCPRRASRGVQRVSKNRIHPRPKEKTNRRARRDSVPPPSFWCLRKDLGKFERLTS